MASKTNNKNIFSHILATEQITVSWLYEDGYAYLYKNVEGSIVANSKAQLIRFELMEINGDDDNFEVIIKKTEHSCLFKADYKAIKDRVCPLKIYESPVEIILYFEDAYNRVYFHLS